jgi:hypothetical protein
MSQLFGFSINGAETKPKGQSPVPPNQDDGAAVVAGGYFGHYVDIDGLARNEYDLIKRYRDMSLHPEVDTAVDEVVNEAIVSDEDESPCQIDLEHLEISEGIKNKIRTEFDYVKRLLGFDKKAHELFRNWYIDGRAYYHKVVDLANPKQGITEVRYIDPLKIKKVKQRVNQRDNELAIRNDPNSAAAWDFGEFVEYYLYNPKGFVTVTGGPDPLQGGVKIAADSITYAPSGLMDLNKKMTLSYLHKSIKSLNQLRMIEDSLVIYRLSRAPERRIFYIDVGNLPKVKAEQYLREVMGRYRNKLVYDAQTGEIRDDKKHMSMLEDFWLPRREGGRGTEITTLPGGQNLGELKDVEYFKAKLYKSLNLPPSRLGEDNKSFNLGKSSEILRDELKFSKFVGRLRKKFAFIFHDMLKTQLLLKGILTPEDWEEMEENIQYDFLFDNHFSELREAELMNTRLDLLMKIDPFVGKYYSIEYVRKQVLMQSENEYMDIDKQMKMDISTKMTPDPVHTNTMNAKALEISAMPPPAPAPSSNGSSSKNSSSSK